MFSRYTPSRYVAKCTVTCVVAIYLLEWFIYHIVCTPSIGWAFLFNCCMCLAVWSYLATALTDPGTRESREWQAWKLKLAADPEAVAQVKKEGEESGVRRRHRWSPGDITWCQECGEERPERAHHCSACGLCILRMDHHCPWIGNCVGWRNHKYFFLLNWWSSWTCVIFIGTLRGPSAASALYNLIQITQRDSCWPAVGVILAFVFLLITGGMWIFAFSMIGSNLTAVEELFPGENPYQLSWFANLTQILGPLNLRMFVPLEPLDRPTGGTTFPSVPIAKATEKSSSVVAATNAADDAAGGTVASESLHVVVEPKSYGSL
mmetsp:Transcript_121434/g.259283  ORF Transcript_121434/g.259283 Transcript_121434/m.259283 type:complete len:320 (+) Transcript_121434:147-1106(+)